MTATLASPAQVVRQLLVDNEFGVMPGIREIDAARTLLVDEPQIFTSSLPDEINYAVRLTNTAGRYFGTDNNTGHRQQHPGVHIMVRHPNENGYGLAVAIEEFFGTVHMQSVTIGCFSYNIQSIYQPRQIVEIGEQEERQRLQWTFEVFVAFQYPPRTLLEE